jgi:hypothetical protein
LTRPPSPPRMRPEVEKLGSHRCLATGCGWKRSAPPLIQSQEIFLFSKLCSRSYAIFRECYVRRGRSMRGFVKKQQRQAGAFL